MLKIKPISKCKTVRELLEKKARWTTDTFARNKDGVAISSEKRAAVSFCLLGACQRVYQKDDAQRSIAVCKLRQAVNELSGYRSISIFNDSSQTTWSQIKAVIKKAGV